MTQSDESDRKSYPATTEELVRGEDSKESAVQVIEPSDLPEHLHRED